MMPYDSENLPTPTEFVLEWTFFWMNVYAELPLAVLRDYERTRLAYFNACRTPERRPEIQADGARAAGYYYRLARLVA